MHAAIANDEKHEELFNEFLESTGADIDHQERMRTLDIELQKKIISDWMQQKIETLGDEKSKPEYWINEMNKNFSHPINATHCLRSFIPALKAQNEHFVKEFCINGGMDRLVSFLSLQHSVDELRLCFLECIKAILNSPHDIGFKMIAHHSHVVQAITDMFTSKDIYIKTLCVQILCLLCWWQQSSYDVVCTGLYCVSITACTRMKCFLFRLFLEIIVFFEYLDF